MSTIPARRRMSLIAVIFSCAVIGMIIGALSAAIDLFNGPIATAVITGLCVLAMGVALWLTVIWWRGADEAVREAHKWAWWWGGSSGMAVAVALILVANLRPEILGEMESLAESDILIAGVILTLSLQIVGYVVAWAGWWLSKR